jgi:hypothetical protein
MYFVFNKFYSTLLRTAELAFFSPNYRSQSVVIQVNNRINKTLQSSSLGISILSLTKRSLSSSSAAVFVKTL